MCRRDATHYRRCNHIITHREQCSLARTSTQQSAIPSKIHPGRLEKTWCHKPKSFESFDRCRECRKAHEAKVREQEDKKAGRAREKEEREENGEHLEGKDKIKGFFKSLFGKERKPSSCSASGSRGGGSLRMTQTQREHGQRIRNSTLYIIEQDDTDGMTDEIDQRRKFAHLIGGRPSSSQGLHRSRSAMGGGPSSLRGSSAAGSRRGAVNDSSMPQWPAGLPETRRGNEIPDGVRRINSRSGQQWYEYYATPEYRYCDGGLQFEKKSKRQVVEELRKIRK